DSGGIGVPSRARPNNSASADFWGSIADFCGSPETVVKVSIASPSNSPPSWNRVSRLCMTRSLFAVRYSRTSLCFFPGNITNTGQAHRGESQRIGHAFRQQHRARRLQPPLRNEQPAIPMVSFGAAGVPQATADHLAEGVALGNHEGTTERVAVIEEFHRHQIK